MAATPRPGYTWFVRALLLFAVLCPFAAPALADEVAYSCFNRTDGRIKETSQRGRGLATSLGCSGFVTPGGKTVDFGFPTSGVLLATKDSRTVVMVQSFLYGGLDKSGGISVYHAGKSVRNPPVVLIYRDGRKLAHHRIDDILLRPRLVSLSLSHVEWLRDDAGLDTTLGDSLTLRTTSFRDVTFDTKTGKITKAVDSKDWRSCDVLAYGAVYADKGGFRMDPAFVVKGKKQSPLYFGGNIAHERDSAYALFCMRASGGSLTATRKIHIHLNALTY